MTCREAAKLLDPFLDGELDARLMRAVALHVTRCGPCEALLQGLERLQDAVAETMAEAVSDVDFSRFWPSITERVDGVQRSWRGVRGRLREWRPALVAAGMAAALAVSAVALWRELPASAPAVVNNQARIDSLTSDAPTVALLSEPKTNTTVIWVSEEGIAP